MGSDDAFEFPTEMTLEEKEARFWSYLDVKRAEKDPHGIWDAAIEIAILQARQKERKNENVS